MKLSRMFNEIASPKKGSQRRYYN